MNNSKSATKKRPPLIKENSYSDLLQPAKKNLLQQAKEEKIRQVMAAATKLGPPGPKHGKPYTRYLNAKCIPTPDGKYTPDALKEMRQAMGDALHIYPLPAEMQFDLACAYESLLAGMVDDLLAPEKIDGGRDPLILKYLQEAAIRYLRWVEDDHIPDATPFATVAQAYLVQQKTVKKWLETWGERDTPSLGDDFGPEQITEFMKATGKAYQRFAPKRKGSRSY